MAKPNPVTLQEVVEVDRQFYGDMQTLGYHWAKSSASDEQIIAMLKLASNSDLQAARDGSFAGCEEISIPDFLRMLDPNIAADEIKKYHSQWAALLFIAGVDSFVACQHGEAWGKGQWQKVRRFEEIQMMAR